MVAKYTIAIFMSMLSNYSIFTTLFYWTTILVASTSSAATSSLRERVFQAASAIKKQSFLQKKAEGIYVFSEGGNVAEFYCPKGATIGTLQEGSISFSSERDLQGPCKFKQFEFYGTAIVSDEGALLALYYENSEKKKNKAYGFPVPIDINCDFEHSKKIDAAFKQLNLGITKYLPWSYNSATSYVLTLEDSVTKRFGLIPAATEIRFTSRERSTSNKIEILELKMLDGKYITYSGTKFSEMQFTSDKFIQGRLAQKYSVNGVDLVPGDYIVLDSTKETGKHLEVTHIQTTRNLFPSEPLTTAPGSDHYYKFENKKLVQMEGYVEEGD